MHEWNDRLRTDHTQTTQVDTADHREQEDGVKHPHTLLVGRKLPVKSRAKIQQGQPLFQVSAVYSRIDSISLALSSGDCPFFTGSWSSISSNSSAASTSKLVFRSGSIQAHYNKLGSHVLLLSCNGLLLLVDISSRVIFFFSYEYGFL